MARAARTKVGRGTLSPAVNDRVRFILEQLVKANGGRGHGGITKVAKIVGRSQGRISAILNGDGATGELVATICEAAGVPESAVFAPTTEEGSLAADVSLNRAKAVRAARLIGLSEVAIRGVRPMPVAKDRSDPSPLEWFEHILTQHRVGDVPR